MTQTKKEKREHLIARKDREKQVHLEARTGEQLPPLLELARIKDSLGRHGITQEMIDAEIERSRKRRLKCRNS